VLGHGQLDAAPGIIEPAADVLGVGILNPLSRYPALDFVVGDYHGTGSSGNRYTVADVIAMAVGNENVVGFDLIGSTRSLALSVSIKKQA
jgi:hypothetical protein